MSGSPNTLLRYIRRLVSPPESDKATDASLLARFISERDETAFAALVDRHGPLVLHVCRRVLGNYHDAEDAFQATFLILARKAGTVRPREALSAWLHVVARRVALKARSAKTCKLVQARPFAEPPEQRLDPLAEISIRELLGILDDELDRLPEVYRLPMILCGLESRSLEEAARQLGWTVGSVKGRLERGRARLQARLLRRGLTLSTALAAAEVSRSTALPAAAARLADHTVRCVVALGTHQTAAAEGVSARAAALAGETLKGMALAKFKIATALLLPTCALAVGFVIHSARQSPTAPTPNVFLSSFPPKVKAGPLAPALVNPPPLAPRTEADSQITVTGRVLGPEGKPFAGAKLYLGYSVRSYFRRSAPDIFGPTSYSLRAISGTDGRFRFAFSSSSEFDPRSLDDSKPAVVAVAGGYGPDWAEIGESAEGAELSLKLVEDLAINGRILDQDRKPVAGAQVVVLDVIADSEEGMRDHCGKYLRVQQHYQR